MITRLRRRILLLIIGVLIVVSTGIVASINLINWYHIDRQAKDALETLAENNGMRPPGGFRLEDKGSFEDEKSREPFRDVGRGGQPPEMADALVSLGNYYVITLNKDGNVEDWTSERRDLYDSAQIEALAEKVVASGHTTGRVGSQFYIVTKQSGKRSVIVLDERLELQNARHILRITALIAGMACLLLCIAAYFLTGVMVRPVQEAFDRQRQFVWDASHELKTPLAVIGANADVLQGEIGDNEYLGYIQSEVKRTNGLVQDLLTLARLDRGTRTAELAPVDLGKAVLSVALPFESTAFEEGKELILDVPEGVWCRGDEAMICQLTVILLGNALKYADDHGTIKVEVTPGRKMAQLKVSNTGEGIKPEDRERIFDRFYRVDSSHNREKEGYGLGLAIAGNIVQLHHGTIQVTGEPGKETVFTVSLPAERTERTKL